MTDIDYERRNTIIYLLQEWGLIELNEDINNYITNNKGSQKISILPYKEKYLYTVKKKFDIV